MRFWMRGPQEPANGAVGGNGKGAHAPAVGSAGPTPDDVLRAATTQWESSSPPPRPSSPPRSRR